MAPPGNLILKGDSKTAQASRVLLVRLHHDQSQAGSGVKLVLAGIGQGKPGYGSKFNHIRFSLATQRLRGLMEDPTPAFDTPLRVGPGLKTRLFKGPKSVELEALGGKPKACALGTPNGSLLSGNMD